MHERRCAPACRSAQTFLAFDFGTQRVGVAVGNSLLRTGTAADDPGGEGDCALRAPSQALVREWQPDALVVGVPFHPDGAPHDNTRARAAFRAPAARPLSTAGARGRRALHHHRGARGGRARCRCGGGRADPRTVPAEPSHEHPDARRRSAVRRAAGRRAQRCCGRTRALVGIWSGGAWLAERLQADLALPGAAGVISSALHRDDFGARGLAAGADATQLPFAIDGAHILLIDDVLLHRPHHPRGDQRAVRLRPPGQRATWRCWSTAAGASCRSRPAFAAARVVLPATQRLTLARDDDGPLRLRQCEDSRADAVAPQPAAQRPRRADPSAVDRGPAARGADAHPRHRRHLPSASTTARSRRCRCCAARACSTCSSRTARARAPPSRSPPSACRADVINLDIARSSHRQGREPARHHRQPVGDACRHVRRAPQRVAARPT